MRVLLFLGIIAINMVDAIDVKINEKKNTPNSKGLTNMLTQSEISKVNI